MADALVTKAQLEARLSKVTVQRIFDDNNDGVADTDPVTQLLKDASSKVRGALPGYDPDTLTAANAAISEELRRIALDAAVAMAAQRRPTIVKGIDWKEMMEQVDNDLEKVRKGQATLGANTNPTPADHSVTVVTSAVGSSASYGGFGDYNS
jgi:phage gp36-like protein